jgi:ATP-dependent exoDNAse (exonuclease V) alpha subunit
MVAHRRVDVAVLNGRAHALMRAAGSLGPDELCGFAVGDRVMLRRNDRGLDVVNGDRGTVVGVAEGALTVDSRGRRVELAYLDRHDRRGRAAVDYGYAITGHLAQGMTCRQTFVLLDDQLSREWAYVALSRGTESNRAYVVEGDAPERVEFAPGASARRDAKVTLVAGLARSEAQRLATDHEPASRELLRAAKAVADAERERTDALAAQRKLQRERPPWYRRAARREHEQSLVAAGETSRLAALRADQLREHQKQLLVALPERRVIVERLRSPERAIGREL